MLLILSGCNSSRLTESSTDNAINYENIYFQEESEKLYFNIKLSENNNFSKKQKSFIKEYVESEMKKLTDELCAASFTETQEVNNQDYTELDLKLSFSSEDLISIIFTGLYSKKNTAHPTHLFFTLNFHPKKMEIIDFSQQYIIDNELYTAFAAQGEKNWIEEVGGIWPEGWGSFSETLCSQDKFYNGLKTSDEYPSVFHYYTNKGVGFSYCVAHALGDHKEVELSYDVLKKRE